MLQTKLFGSVLSVLLTGCAFRGYPVVATKEWFLGCVHFCFPLRLLSLSLKRPAPLFVILACYLPIFCMQQFSIVSRDCLYVQDFSLVFVFCMNSTFRLNC